MMKVRIAVSLFGLGVNREMQDPVFVPIHAEFIDDIFYNSGVEPLIGSDLRKDHLVVAATHGHIGLSGSACVLASYELQPRSASHLPKIPLSMKSLLLFQQLISGMHGAAMICVNAGCFRDIGFHLGLRRFEIANGRPVETQYRSRALRS